MTIGFCPEWLDKMLPEGRRTLLGRRCLLIEGERHYRIKFGESLEDAHVLQREALWLNKLKQVEVIVPRCISFYKNANRVSLITSFIPGKSASDWLKEYRFEPYYQEQLLKYLESALNTLEDLHRIGLVHGDIKPSNILFMENNQATLIDFSNVRRLNAPWCERGFSQLTPAYSYPQPSLVAKFEHDYFALLLSITVLLDMPGLACCNSVAELFDILDQGLRQRGMSDNIYQKIKYFKAKISEDMNNKENQVPLWKENGIEFDQGQNE